MLIFFLQQHRSLCDLLTEALYSAKMRENPVIGPDILTFVWGGIEAFGLIALLIVGQSLDLLGTGDCELDFMARN
jgi:hypothetical protein